jgi:Domain of unknown function (DUF6456)
MTDENSYNSTRAAESPLLRLFTGKATGGKAYIDLNQFKAGERLRSDFERAHFGQRTTAAYSESSGSGGRYWQQSDNAVEKLNVNAIAARQNLQKAFVAVGPELSGILYQVCCVASGFEQAERILALPARSGKAVLALGLTRLARHYGYIKNHAPPKDAAITKWALDDYRPIITPLAHQP